MGINTAWKKILYEIVPDAFQEGLDCPIPVIIDDILIRLNRSIHCVKTGKKLGIDIRSWIMKTFTSDLEHYVVLIDENEFVHKSKHQERRSRKKGFLPFVEGKDNITIGPDELPDSQRLMASRWIYPQLFHFMTNEISKVIEDFAKRIQENPVWPESKTITKPNNNPNSKTPIKYRMIPHLEIDGAILEGNKQEYVVFPRYPFTPRYSAKSFHIGESDLKIVNHINLKRDKGFKTILVRTIDSDVIPILLLNTINWIDQEDQNIQTDVYIECLFKPDSKGSKIFNYINITKLWRGILDYFLKRFPKIEHPIFVMTLLMMSTKTDYVKGLKQIGPVTTWKAFHERGHEIFSFYDSKEKIHRQLITSVGTPFGNPRDGNLFVLNENLMIMFIGYLYHYELKIDTGSNFSKMQSLSEIKNKTDKIDKNRSKKTRYDMKTQDEVMVYIRNITWNLLHWCNSSTRLDLVPDPLLKHPKSQKPIYGWEDKIKHVTLEEFESNNYDSSSDDDDDDDSNIDEIIPSPKLSARKKGQTSSLSQTTSPASAQGLLKLLANEDDSDSTQKSFTASNGLTFKIPNKRQSSEISDESEISNESDINNLLEDMKIHKESRKPGRFIVHITKRSKYVHV